MKHLYIVRFKSPEANPQRVLAATHGIADDYLFLFDEDDEIARVFLLDDVEDWDIEPANA